MTHINSQDHCSFCVAAGLLTEQSSRNLEHFLKRFVQLNPSFIGRPPGLQQTERQLFPVFMWIKPLDLRDFRISKPRRFAPSKPRVLSIPGAHQILKPYESNPKSFQHRGSPADPWTLNKHHCLGTFFNLAPPGPKKKI